MYESKHEKGESPEHEKRESAKWERMEHSKKRLGEEYRSDKSQLKREWERQQRKPSKKGRFGQILKGMAKRLDKKPADSGKLPF